MKAKHRQSGMTLTEMVIVVAIVALLTTLAAPAMRSLFGSMATQGGVQSLVSSAMSSARATAAKERRYAGVRFQEDKDGHQYVIFIIYDYDKTKLANGFRAVADVKPIKLPDTIGIMDINAISLSAVSISASELANATTFSIVFSPSGKLVIHLVRTRNRDGYLEADDRSTDDIFNTPTNVKAGIAMFYQDYGFDGFIEESSRRNFVFYDKVEFKQAVADKRWSEYLRELKLININAYTGRIISTD